MKIAIDIRPLRDTVTGIGRYLYKLIDALSRCDRWNEYLLFYSNIKGNAPAGLPQNDNFRTVSYRFPGKLITALWAYSEIPPAEALLGSLDVFHAPCFQVPPVRRCARVFTLHDLIPIIHPELAIPSAVRHFRPRLRHYVKRADIIVAISKATAADIATHLGVPEDKIAVVYQGTTALARAGVECVAAVKRKFGIEGDYVLFVSRLEPRKNLPRLLKAFEVSGLHCDFELVLAGPSGWYMKQFYQALEALPCRDRVRRLDYVSDADLAALYSGAAFFAYPSLLEGFGLPILEAMSVGCPVLTAGVSSMPEVAGEAALYVDPLDVDSIADGLRRMADDTVLRKRIAELGHQRVKLFSWERTAAEMVKIYERAHDLKAAGS
jgi:glycosyltransferase involved in cell wall biosynthesis